MRWIQAKLYTARAGLEPVFGALMSAGVTGVQIEDDEDLREFLADGENQWDYVDDELMNRPPRETSVTFYVSDNASGRETLLLVKDGVARLAAQAGGTDFGRLFLDLENVDDEAWLNEWKKYYKPFPAGARVVIRPAWEDYEAADGETVVTLNPGPVFGTGLHQSTQLCVQQLEKRVVPGANLLDLGCGSGILSVTALLLGAGYAFAVDMDPNAVGVVCENALLNGIKREKLTVATGNILSDTALMERLKRTPFDIVVANIVADVIISLLPNVPACLSTGGVFIASGIISERLNDVAAAFTAQGLSLLESPEKDGWVCLAGIKI